jgi:hypothetical protein
MPNKQTDLPESAAPLNEDDLDRVAAAGREAGLSGTDLGSGRLKKGDAPSPAPASKGG